MIRRDLRVGKDRKTLMKVDEESDWALELERENERRDQRGVIGQ